MRREVKLVFGVVVIVLLLVVIVNAQPASFQRQTSFYESFSRMFSSMRSFIMRMVQQIRIEQIGRPETAQPPEGPEAPLDEPQQPEGEAEQESLEQSQPAEADLEQINETDLNETANETDTTPPVITITTPSDGVETEEDSLWLRGTIEDDSEIEKATSKINNGTERDLDITDGSFSKIIYFEEGENTIIVYAEDSFANSRTVKLMVRYLPLTPEPKPTVVIPEETPTYSPLPLPPPSPPTMDPTMAPICPPGVEVCGA